MRRWSKQNGSDGEAALLEQASNHEAPFGDEQIVGPEPAGIADVRVIGYPWIVEAIDRLHHAVETSR